MRKLLTTIIMVILSLNLLAETITMTESPLKVNTLQLKKITPKDIIYTGKVETFESVLLAFNVPGIIKSVLPLGTLVKAPITDNKGKVLTPGTIVAEQYTEQQQYALKAAELAEEIAKVNLKTATIDYERQKSLIAKDAVAQQSYDDAVNAYLNAKLNYENACNNLVTAKYNLSCTKIVAPFDGIVSEIIRGPNRGVGNGDDILQITRITPVMVKVAFSDVIRSLINKSMVIEVYSKRLDTPVPAWVEPNPRDTLNSEFFTGNKLIITNDLTPAQEALPKVYGVLPATDMAMLPNPSFKTSKLSVPETAIHKDSKGYYVFKAVGQKALDLKKGISTEFVVQKVYVKPGDVGSLFNLGFQGEVRYCDLSDPGTLEFHDIIIVNADKNLENGKKAVLVERQFMFQPDELVAVKIPDLSKPGFYVPDKAIIIIGKGRYYVYLNDNGIAKMVTVKVTGTTGSYYKIEGDGITEDAQIVIFDKLSTLKKCFNGKSLSIGKILPAPKHLEHSHCTPLRFPKQPVEEIYHL